jgi:hypothetical protein
MSYHSYVIRLNWFLFLASTIYASFWLILWNRPFSAELAEADLLIKSYPKAKGPGSSTVARPGQHAFFRKLTATVTRTLEKCERENGLMWVARCVLLSLDYGQEALRIRKDEGKTNSSELREYIGVIGETLTSRLGWYWVSPPLKIKSWFRKSIGRCSLSTSDNTKPKLLLKIVPYYDFTTWQTWLNLRNVTIALPSSISMLYIPPKRVLHSHDDKLGSKLSNFKWVWCHVKWDWNWTWLFEILLAVADVLDGMAYFSCIWCIYFLFSFPIHSYHEKVPYDPPTLEIKATYGLVAPEEMQVPTVSALWTPFVYRAVDVSRLQQNRDNPVSDQSTLPLVSTRWASLVLL